MMDLDSLSRRARRSGDGEAYVALARDVGSRYGVGARYASDGKREFFIEVVLDPFPHRPEVDPSDLAGQSARAARLRRRGYSLCCDDAGFITCERTVDRDSVQTELRAVRRLTRPALNGRRPRAGS